MTMVAVAMRRGLIMRTLAHGTIIVWDLEQRRAYPYYKAGPTDAFRINEEVLFSTDETDTLVTSVDRKAPPSRRKGLGRRAKAERNISAA